MVERKIVNWVLISSGTQKGGEEVRGAEVVEVIGLCFRGGGEMA